MIKTIKVYKDYREVDLKGFEYIGLGVEQDNKVDVLRFQFDEFVDGVGILITDILAEDNNYLIMPLTKNVEEKYYEVQVVDEMLVNETLTMQLQITSDEEVLWHSKQFTLNVFDKLNATNTTIPSGVENWLNYANEQLLNVERKIEESTNATENAETQSNYAKEQGDYAREQGKNAEDKVEEASKLIDSYDETLKTIQTSEETRISNENTRVTNEETRVENENTRISNEEKRVENESDREKTFATYEQTISDLQNRLQEIENKDYLILE